MDIQPSPHCPFCAEERLATVMATSAHFRIIADHAPLVPGHTLIMPRAHYPCYGAVPAELDDELARLRTMVQDFLAQHYPPMVWFEHGVFHQTVFHAHLHAMPLGLLSPSVVRDPKLGGQPVTSRDEVRAWYLQRGYYTYLEEPDGFAALFPAEEDPYRALLRALFTRNKSHGFWTGPSERFITGAPKVHALINAWRTDGLSARLE